MSDKDEVRAQIKELQQKFRERAKNVSKAVSSNVTKACFLVEATAKQGMTDTEVDTSVSYGPHGHHPSVPGAYPAVDLGLLRMSVTHDVSKEGGKIQGRVGSTIVDPPYGLFLEEGTSRMAARPWLAPSVLENEEEIVRLLQSSAKGDAHAEE